MVETNGNLEEAIDLLTGHPHYKREKDPIQPTESEKENHEDNADKLNILESMGFNDKENNLKVLEKANGNIEYAINILSGCDLPEDEDYSKIPKEKTKYEDEASYLESLGY